MVVPELSLLDQQRAHERWRYHVRMLNDVHGSQKDLWKRACSTHEQRQAALLAQVPAWRRTLWSKPWGAWDHQRWIVQHRLDTQSLFLQDWKRTLDDLPQWVEDGEQGLLHAALPIVEGCWAAWCVGVLDVLDRLLDAHPERRGHAMPFRGLRFTLRSALDVSHPPFLQALIDRWSLERTMAMAPPPASYNQPDDKGYTVLHHAVLAERWDVVDVLLQQGASAHQPVKSGGTSVGSLETPLFLACLTGDVRTVQGLLTAGAEANGPVERLGEPWFSPLHVAAKSGHKNVVMILLTHEADLQRQDGQAQTPAMAARFNRQEDLAAWMDDRLNVALE